MKHIKLFITPSEYPFAGEEIVSLGVPFPKGGRRPGEPLAAGTSDRQLPVQIRELSSWPDGSSKWAFVCFPLTNEMAQKGTVVLSKGEQTRVEEDALRLSETADGIEINTGVAIFRVSKIRASIIDSARISGKEMLTGAKTGLELVDLRGRLFQSALDDKPVVEVLESGPYRALVRQRGLLKNAKTDSAPLLMDARIAFYRGSSRISVTMTYTASSEVPELYFRDLRWALAHRFEEDRNCDMTGKYVSAHMGKGEVKAPAHALPRFSIGCGFGDVYEDHIDKENRYFLLQDKDDFFNVYQEEPGYGIYPVASGGARGEMAPGWVELCGGTGRILWRMADFQASFPKEIEVSERRLAFGIWPEQALPSYLALPHDPEPVDPAVRWSKEGYECLATFPQYAGASVSRKSYALVKGTGRTHFFDLEFLPRDKVIPALDWNGSRSSPPLVWVDPCAVNDAAVIGPLTGIATGNMFEEMLERAYAWDKRMRRLYRHFGELEYGDRQRHYHTVRMPKAGKGVMRRKEDGGFYSRCHPRAGWWNNNERDTHRGYYVQYMRSGRRDLYQDFLSSACHNMEVDLVRVQVREEGPGLVGHQEGHNRHYGASGFDIDHNWCTGFFDLYHLTGDPRALESARLVADHLAKASIHGYRWWGVEKEKMHLRYFFRAVWEISAAYIETHEARYLEAAREGAEEILRRQKEDGSIGSDSYSEGSCEMALLKYYLATGEQRVLEALARAVNYSTADLESVKISAKQVAEEKRRALLVFNSCRVLKGEFVGLPKTAECLAYLLTWGYKDLYPKAIKLLEVALAAQDRTGRAIEDGNWNEEHRAMPYRTGIALQHVPSLLAAVRPTTKQKAGH